jgi:putative phage-type endonuclease
MMIRYENREDWLRKRDELASSGRLGGSMVGTAAGVDPWKSPYHLWAEMRGELTRPDLSDKESIRVGHDLEEYVARRFCEVSGKAVHRVNGIYTNDGYPHLFATIDRKISGEESGLECKTANAYRDGAFLAGSFPDGYYKQVKTYLAVTGLERWYLAVLVMGIAFRVFLITRNASDLEALPSWVSGARLVTEMELGDCEIEAAAFIEHVKNGTPPELTGADGERDVINARYGNQSCGTMPDEAARETIDKLCVKRAELKAAGEANAAELKAIENEIVARLSGCENSVGTLYKVSYKWSETKRLDKEGVAKALGGEIPAECYKVTRGATLRITPNKKNFK